MKDSKESFFEDVYKVVRLIPKGRVTSYGAIAKFLGIKSSARMIGWALKFCNDAKRGNKKIPAHRVVNRMGILSGKMYFEDPTQMQKLLEKEGLTIVEDQVQDFEKFFWDPNKELL